MRVLIGGRLLKRRSSVASSATVDSEMLACLQDQNDDVAEHAFGASASSDHSAGAKAKSDAIAMQAIQASSEKAPAQRGAQ